MSRQQRSKLKWTEQMNTDLLECKKKAMEFLKSENPPCYVNGRKKGYIQVMKDLWDKKGYEHLGLKSRNLRDQAAMLENAAAETRAIGKVSGGAVIDDEREQTLDENQRRHNTISQHEFNNFENQNTISQNANLEVNSNLDLHTDNDIVQTSHERQETEAVEAFEVINDYPGEPHAGIHEAGRLPDKYSVLENEKVDGGESSAISNQKTEEDQVQQKEKRKSKSKKKTTKDDASRKPQEVEQEQQPQQQKRKTVVVAGDSIIKYVKGWELSNTEQNVAVKSFSGATVEDMNDFLRPTTRRQPDKLVIHVG